MIGVFDSGVGGFLAVRHLRALLPRADILCLADRKNAPYGTKERKEIINFAERNIERLFKLGANRILIACCTASSAHRALTQRAQDISVPIIRPTAERAVELTDIGSPSKNLSISTS